ncbi:hypothetical protein ABW20_dc0109170 [Dactylellina cionopaga]|nr:hypothetical protein ABW20_dc0109170 [Dactylellina cionopaga]
MDANKEEAIAEGAAWRSSVPESIFEEGLYNVSGSGYTVAQGKTVKQNNFKDNSRPVKIKGGIYNENVFLPRKKPVVLIKDINITIPFRMPFFQNTNFMGRERQISAIHDHFRESRSQKRLCVFALTGTGGMGKTQIALEYAYRYWHEYTAIFWLSSASEETLITSFVEIMQRIIEEQKDIIGWPGPNPDYNMIALKLGIPGLIDGSGVLSTVPETADSIKRAVLNWLQLPGNSEWLLIFDNADDPGKINLRDYLPNGGHGAIFITSRRLGFPYAAKQIKIGGLDERSAIKLLLHLVQPTDSTEAVEDDLDATNLVEILGFMPLAISHAGCYIRATKISFREYITFYYTQFIEVQSIKPNFGWDYQSTAAATWEISFSEVEKKDNDAALLLLVCSYFNPSEIFESMWEDEQSDERFRFQLKDRIRLLRSYSLVDVIVSGAFSIHPVVHSWARERLKEPERSRRMKDAVMIVGESIQKENMSRESRKRDAQEGKRVGAHLEYLDRYVAPRLSELGLHDEAGPEQETLLDLVHNIALTFQHQGKYDKAMRWYERALAGYEKALGVDHPSTLRTVNNIAGVFKNQGQYDEAMQWYQRALAGLEKGLGVDRPSTIKEANNIAGVFKDQGEYHEIEEASTPSGKENTQTFITKLIRFFRC